ncbi:conserved hypothetical protein [Gammaproteobacteria bacterium]
MLAKRMKQFSKLYSDFWINYDNVEVMSLGIDAQLMGLYLQGNHHHNMLGTYYLPLLYIASDLRLSVKRVKTILEKLCSINYCRYDYKTQYIWVCDLAFEQIGINIGAKDNRIKALQAVWESLPLQLEFLEGIYNKYHAGFYLKSRVCKNSPKDNCHLMETDDDNEETGKKLSPKIFLSIINDKNSDSHSASSLENSPSILSSFESGSKVPESSLNTESSDISCQESFSEPSLEDRDGALAEVSFDTPDKSVGNTISCVVSTLDSSSPSNEPKAEECINALVFSNNVTEGIANTLEDFSKIHLLPSEAPSNLLQRPFEGDSKPLQSPLEGPSEPLRSNIEYRSKIIEDRNNNIENRSNKKEIERKEIKNKKIIPPDITSQQFGSLEGELVYENSFFHFSSFFENCKNIKNTDNPAISGKSNNDPDIQTLAILPDTKISTNPNLNSSIAAVFEHWKTVMRHPEANLDYKRKFLIRRALQLGYNVEQLCMAITGCFRSPFYTGTNELGQRYVGLHIILRDADQIDKFIYNCHNPPKPHTEADCRTQANVCAASEWVNKKSDEFVNITGDNYA